MSAPKPLSAGELLPGETPDGGKEPLVVLSMCFGGCHGLERACTKPDPRGYSEPVCVNCYERLTVEAAKKLEEQAREAGPRKIEAKVTRTDGFTSKTTTSGGEWYGGDRFDPDADT